MGKLSASVPAPGEVPFTRCVAVHQVAPSGLGASWRHVSWRQFLKKKLFKCSTSWSRFLRSKRCHFPTHIHLATSLPEAAPCHSALVKQSSRLTPNNQIIGYLSDTRAEEAEDAEAELQALHKEDHDAEIKAIAEAEHIKATERAKRGQTVPEEVTCYHELDSAAKQQQALADRLGEEAEKAAQSLKQATYLKEKAATDTQKFKIRMDSDHKMKTDAETQYKSEHSVALNAFEAARGNLDSYNNDRKKVDLDSTRSKQILAKYLDYKKKFIQANADSDGPTQSKEVVQYRLLSEKYLKEYHSLQVKMQQNYASATHESEQYQELSQRYQRIAGDANDIAAEVTRTSAAFTKSRKEHTRQHKVYVTQEKEAQRWEGILAQTKEDAKAARASYSKQKKHEEASKINYLKLRSMAVKYGEMGKDAETTTDLNRMRMLN